MNARLKSLREIFFTLILCFLLFQAWRGVCINGWALMKGFFHLTNLRHSVGVLSAENQRMSEEVKKIQQNPVQSRSIKAAHELDLVTNPDKEVIIHFAD
jgi:hypothetical protein